MSENNSTICESIGESVLSNSSLMAQQINSSVGGASCSTGEVSGQNPLKKQIDPLELLNCLSILLNSNGGIKSIDEVQRVAGLMGKYSKKLVSKCIYLNILQATEEPLLDEFYKETGWNLVCSWLTEAMLTKNYPLAEQILSLLLRSPVTVDRLKRNNMPKMVKDLSKDCPHIAAQETAEQVVQQWKELVKGYTSEGGTSATSLNRDLNSVDSSHSETSNASESMKVSVTNPVPLNIVNSQVSSIIVNKKSLSEEREATAILSETSSHDISDMEGQAPNVEMEIPLPIPKLKIGRGRGSPGRGGQRGVGRGRARRKRGTAVVGRGRGKSLLSYAELLCQDIDSTYDESDNKSSSRHRSNSGSSATSSGSGTSGSNNEEKKSSPKEGAVPPLRITIRNGVKVLRNDSNDVETDSAKKKRPSVESTDSDDNKPLSIIKEKCQKSSSSPPPQSSSEKMEDSNSTSEEGTSLNNIKKEKMTVTEIEKSFTKDDEDEEEEIIKKRKKGKRRIMIYGSDDDDEEAQDKDSKKSKFSDEEKQVKLKRQNSESELKKKKDDSKTKLKEEGETSETSKGKEDERKVERKLSYNDKNKIKNEKDKEKDEKRNKDKEKYKDRDKERSKHKSSKDRDKEKDRDRDKERNREKDKYRDREKERDRDKDKKREKERRRDSDDKDSKRKEQLERDKATLDKVKPLSTQGLSKIPRKTPSSLSSPKNNTTPVSFLDALGSADSELEGPDGKRLASNVIKSKSRGFRNTGLLDETIKPPGVAGKRSSETVKLKTSSIPSPISSASSSSIKASPSSAPPMGDRPGGVKLISPKRPVLSDDGGFMAALTAAGENRKKIVRKRKSSDSESKSEANQNKVLKTEHVKDSLEESKTEEDMTPNEGQIEEEVPNKTEDKENILLSPTSIKPTFNFYKETLSESSSKEETKSDSEITTDAASGDDALSATSSKDDAVDEISPSDIKRDEESMEVDESADDNVKEEPMEIAAIDGDGNGTENSALGVKDENMKNNLAGSDSDYLDEAPVPAPAQEDYERVEVTFAPAKNLRGVLVYHRPQNKKKKVVKWKTDADLKKIFYFPMDETERVNVNTIKFNEMLMMEKAGEKELMFGKNRNRLLLDGMNMMDNGRPNNCIDYGPYKLYPVHLPTSSNVTPGAKSVEKQVQAQREHATMATFFHPAMLPDSPSEPDPEMVTRVEPVIIPLKDVTGSDGICDNRGIPWPEPLLNPPDYYMEPPSPHPGPPQHGGGHWVLGNHTVSRFSGGPSMFGGHNAPQGPGTNPGFVPPPQGFPGDMRGGWGGHSDFSGPPMLMPNGPPPMGMPPSIGGPNMHGGPPLQGGPGHGPGPGPGMGIGGGPPPLIGNRDNYPRYRRGGGGSNWRGHQGNRGYCKHFQHGNCRHGDDCKFLHVPS